jgi:hypothetical protein
MKFKIMKFNINYNTLKKEFIIRSIKIIDISIITVLYFVIGYFLSCVVNKMYYTFDSNSKPNKAIIFLEVCGQLAVIGIIIYFIRNIIQLISFPLEGIYGSDHSKVKELNSGSIALSFGVFYAQDNIKEKLSYILS